MAPLHRVKSSEQPVNSEITKADRPQTTFLDEKLARIEAIDLEKQDHKPDKKSESEEDLDALIRELNAADPDNETDESTGPGNIANILLGDLSQTDIEHGLSASEVDRQRKKHGLNQLREEKENLFLKFIMFFVGPIQFVMEVSLVAEVRYKPC